MLFYGPIDNFSSVPYQQSLNNTTHTIGADTRNYVRFIDTLEKSGDTSVLLKQAFISISGGDRPLSLLFLLLIVEISPYDHLLQSTVSTNFKPHSGSGRVLLD